MLAQRGAGLIGVSSRERELTLPLSAVPAALGTDYFDHASRLERDADFGPACLWLRRSLICCDQPI